MRRKVELGDKEISIVGTAHVSQESKVEVKDTIEEIDPDHIFVELDQNRFESLRGESGWKDLDITDAIREGKGNLLLLNLFLSIYQRKLGLEQDMKPGEELLQGVESAEKMGIKYSLVDQDINKTLSRALDSLSVLDKIRLISSFLIPSDEEIEIDDLKEGDMLGSIIQELEEEFPELKRVFLDERNAYMAEKILEEDFETAVVVVGAAHVEGLEEELKKEERNTDFETSKGLPWFKIANYGFTALIILGIGFSFYSSIDQGITNLKVWIGANSFLALLGAIIAGSHVSTWIVSFLSSPLTSINPLLPAGLVAAFTESKVEEPTVQELEEVPRIENYRELWNNQVGVILLTFLLVNLGSGSGAIISGIYIIMKSFFGF